MRCVLRCGLWGAHVFIEVEGVLANHTTSFLLARLTKVLKPRNLGVERWGMKYRFVSRARNFPPEQPSVVQWRRYDEPITVPEDPMRKPCTRRSSFNFPMSIILFRSHDDTTLEKNTQEPAPVCKVFLMGVRLEMQNDVVQSATEAYDLAIDERQTKKNDARIRTLPK